jgi:hypothetical protein
MERILTTILAEVCIKCVSVTMNNYWRMHKLNIRQVDSFTAEQILIIGEFIHSRNCTRCFVRKFSVLMLHALSYVSSALRR